MSVKHGVLALLSRGPRHGAGLKAEFEAATGGTWPLNVGQVYTTLARLERDGLVVGDGGPDGEGKIAYRLTPDGLAATDSWWLTPVERETPARDELVIKVALAVVTPGVDPYAVLQTQRAATMRHLRELTRRKIALDSGQGGAEGAAGRRPGPPTPGTSVDHLLVEHQLFTVEAELRWLDHVETVLQYQHRTTRTAPSQETR